jgi:hypothetical protein
MQRCCVARWLEALAHPAAITPTVAAGSGVSRWMEGPGAAGTAVADGLLALVPASACKGTYCVDQQVRPEIIYPAWPLRTC